jgi:hypothetical protein
MPWARIPGSNKRKWISPPWITNPDFKAQVMAVGKGPATWYRFNAWEIQVEQLGNRTFRIGEGTNPVELPSYLDYDEKKQALSLQEIVGTSRKRTKIWSETEGLMVDPLIQSPTVRYTYSGSWVTKNDVRLWSRATECLGIIDANPGIKLRTLAGVYNTNTRNIRRILMILSAAGVRFYQLGNLRVRIQTMGIFDEHKVRELYKKSNGLDEIVEKVKCVFEDVSDERTGKMRWEKVRLEMRRLWNEKLLRDKQLIGVENEHD